MKTKNGSTTITVGEKRREEAGTQELELDDDVHLMQASERDVRTEMNK